MSIAEVRERCKTLLARVPPDALVVALLLAASLASFGIGYLAGQSGAGADRVTIEIAPELEEAAARDDRRDGVEEEGRGAGAYVASKNGAKYYLPSCSGAKRINAENKVWFATVAAAEAAGYAPAANCPGL